MNVRRLDRPSGLRARLRGATNASLALLALALSACAPALQQGARSPTEARPRRDPSPSEAPVAATGDVAVPRPRSDGTHPIGERPEWMRSLALPELPLRWYPRVTTYLEQYKNEPRSREIIRGWLRRFGAHRAPMEAVLAREGLPRGLVFVAMIESGFNASALSNRGAGGFWQFRPAVARAYGLEVSFWVDERRELEKSTVAAARYLADLQHRFGSWELALAGYNAGPFAVLESIARFNTNDYGTLCRVEAGLPWETTEYVPKVLAVALVEKNRRVFGFDEASPEPTPPSFDLAHVPPATSFEALAARLDVKPEELAQLNPAYLRQRTPPDRGPVAIRVPVGKAARIDDSSLIDRGLMTITVKPGETLGRLARARKLSADRLRRLNAVLDDSEVTPGTTILVPRPAPARPAKTASPSTGKRSPSSPPPRRKETAPGSGRAAAARDGR